MDIFVIPVGGDRYELYCEPAGDADDGNEAVSGGLLGAWKRQFDAMLRAAEDRRQQRQRADAPAEMEGSKGRLARLQERVMMWVAERVAEQRLLWNLRRQTRAVAVHPPDMTFDEAHRLIQRTLRHDYDRHRRWMIVDLAAFLATFIVLGPLFLLVPGVANLPALYFGFRVVGHWLSMRGAVQGLERIAWSGRPCPPLGELRDLASMEPRARDQCVRDVAARLRLRHLTAFFERIAVPPA
jgi:hypothetical protein